MEYQARLVHACVYCRSYEEPGCAQRGYEILGRIRELKGCELFDYKGGLDPGICVPYDSRLAGFAEQLGANCIDDLVQAYRNARDFTEFFISDCKIKERRILSKELVSST